MKRLIDLVTRGRGVPLVWVPMLVLVFSGCTSAPSRPEGVADFLKALEDQGYRLNSGLAGIYEPGNVIQVTEQSANGKERALPSPVVFLWGPDCFPDQAARVSPFVIADSSGRQSSSFSLGAGLIGKLLPSLNIDRKSVADYHMTLGNTTVHTIAKGDLSRNFSSSCVRKLSQAIEDGDRAEWFAVIVEAVKADSLDLEMTWAKGLSAGARVALLDSIQGQLGAVAGAAGPKAAVGMVSDNANSSVIRAQGPLILGYRARPLQPVYAK